MNRVTLHCGDVLAVLRTLPSESTHMVCTSPPYWGLRDYGVPGQLGLEKTPEEYIEKMVAVFREVRRVLRKDGTLWLNMGDSYNSQPASNGISFRRGREKVVPCGRDLSSLKPKDLCMIPARLALALQADGWWLRSDIIWAKPNPMPESVTDRPTTAHEHIFLLTKSPKYFYDADAVRECLAEGSDKRGNDSVNNKNETFTQSPITTKFKNEWFRKAREGLINGRNLRSIWTIATVSFPEAHFATFPPAIPERCIKAGSKDGDLILDPFSGAATTLMVAAKLGRDAVGIELNPNYVTMSVRRLKRELGMLCEIITK